jgi:hypothetical protein
VSVRFFCDVYEKELLKADHDRLKLQWGKVTIEVITAVDDAWNSGQICHKCIREVIEKGEPFKPEIGRAW